MIYNNNGIYGQDNPSGEKNIVMVPIRFISQALGATVDYKDGTGNNTLNGKGIIFDTI